MEKSLKSESESHSVVSHSLQPHGKYSPWNSPGQNTGGGNLSLFHQIFPTQELSQGLPDGTDGKVSAYNVGDLGSIPGSGRAPGEENGNPLQYSCLENPTDRGVW